MRSDSGSKSIAEQGSRKQLMREKEFAIFLLPLILSAVFQQCYSLINAGVVGKYRSESAVAVIGSCAFLGTLQHFIFNGMTTGFGFCLCRAAGEEDAEALRKTFWGTVWLTALLAILALVAAALARPVLVLLNVPEELRREALPYAAWILAGSGASAYKNLLVWTIQSLRKTTFTGIIHAVSVCTQTILTVFLIGFLRLPVWASAAAILCNSLLICFCMAVYLLLTADHRLKFAGLSALCVPLVGDLLKSGLAKTSMMAMVAFGSIFSQRISNTLPVEQIAGMTYANTISNVFQVIVGAYGTAAAILCADWYVKGRPDTLRQEVRRLMSHSVAAGLLLAGISWCTAPGLLRLLASASGSGAVREAGVLYLRISQWGLAGLAVYLTGRYTLQGMENNFSQVILGFVEMMAVILMSELVTRVIGLPGAALKLAVTWCVCGFMSAILLRKELRRFEAHGGK